MKEIKLTTGEIAFVDDEDYERVNKYKWYNHCGYPFCTKRTMKVFMHRFILGAKKNDLVDHKDMNRFNNQKSNIRICTFSQNSQNRTKINRKTTSKYKGVFWNKIKNKWRGRITINGIEKGRDFDDEVAAALWYDKKAIELFGKFARINFPKGYSGRKIKERKYSSAFRGVIWDSSRKKWKAEIRRQGVRYYLGRYSNECDAANVYKVKELELYGRNKEKNCDL